MSRLYAVTGKLVVDVITLVRAESPEQALKLADERAINLGPRPDSLDEWINLTDFPDKKALSDVKATCL